MCGNHDENIDHFMIYLAYGQGDSKIYLKYICGDDTDKQNSIAIETRRGRPR